MVHRKRRRRLALPDPSARGTGVGAAVPTGSALAVAGGVALVLFGCLAVAAFAANGSTTRTVPALYAHEGAFSYRAQAEPGPVYPTGSLTTGAPVFTRLVDTLGVAFRYRLATEAPEDIHGTIRLDAVVSDTTGWKRTFPVSPRHTFSGPTARTAGTFDVRAFEDLVTTARQQTAAPFASVSVELRPVVELSGSVGATPVDASFDPALTLSYDNTTLRPIPAPEDLTSRGRRT